MKINFEIPTDGKVHRYCPDCMSQDVGREIIDGKTVYPCRSCNTKNHRTIYFNTHKYWVDEKRELWHESSGVFVRNSENKYLFYTRNEYPYLLTVPSGHVDNGELAVQAATRELREETGITGKLVHLGTEEVAGDSCSAGADYHKWHVFLLDYDQNKLSINIQDEGDKAIWLTPAQAQKQGTVYVVDYIIKKYSDRL